MDDLLGEDWQSAPKQPTTAPLNPSTFNTNYSSFRVSPKPQQNGGAPALVPSRPSSTVNNAAKIGSKPTTPANDAFGSLTSLPSQKAANSMSIQERQRQLIEEKRKQQLQQAQMWDSLGSGRGTPEARVPSPGIAQKNEEDVDDILAAFNRAAPVDKASHYPPPSGPASGRSTPATAQPLPMTSVAPVAFDDDDDPFGLAEVAKKSNGRPQQQKTRHTMDDDDILGDLGKPVTAAPPRQPSPEAAAPEWDENVASSRATSSAEPQDRALAELIDMGFPEDTAKLALAETGGDVQNAVGWLLQQAHEASKQQAKEESQSRRRSPSSESRNPSQRRQGDQEQVPSWMRESRSSSAARRQDNRSPADGDKDAAKVASEFGNKLFKSANSIWKASQKQMAKTMADFQQERDASQPKWMTKNPSEESSRASSQRRPDPRSAAQKATDEAAMLDAPRDVLPPRPSRSSAREMTQELPIRDRSTTHQNRQRASPQPAFVDRAPPLDKRPTTKLSRQDVEDQSAQAYVSPARRKRSTPKPEPQPEPEVDLFGPAPTPALPAAAASASKPVSRPAAPTTRPKAPPRTMPSVSPAALSSSAASRKKGGEAFKRGDFAAAHESYTAALSPLPATHPIAIIVLCNRALTAIKTGDPKVAVSDADQALAIIGPGQGANESIELGAGEGVKDMREFFGKALMRKAEALEHMEKWFDAAGVWTQAVQAGVGGAISIRGRDRCEKTASPQTAPKPKAAPVRSVAPAAGKAAPAKGLGNSMQRPALSSATSAEAVKRLRLANAAAEKADDEKFALTDAVDARLTAWKGGKADNLRALLQSLDGVLWEGAGWKKVGMSDLVMPNKVKIIYMKAIGKVHPDKVRYNLSNYG
jgi:hypothetical protein